MIFNMRAKEILGVIECDSSELRGSYESALKINKIGGVCVQGENPTPTNPQEIKKSVVSEIRTHRNQLFNIDAVNVGKFILDAGGLYDNSYWNTSDFIKVSALTNYCVSQSEKVYFHYRIGFYGADKKIIRVDVIENSNITKYTFITPENTEYIRVCYSTNISGATIDRGNIMLNLGTDALPWESYKESVITLSQPIELYGIGDLQDTIEGGKVKRKLKRIVCNGTEDWKTSSTLVGRYFLENIGCVHYARLICSQAIGLKIATTNPNECYANTSNNPKGRFLINTKFATVEEWKLHLQANPMTIVYEVAEEVVEDLPLTDQIALSCLKTFHGVTHVEFAGEVQPTLNSEYATNLEGAITLQAHADNRIGKANTLVNRAEGENNVFEVRVEHGLMYLYKDDVLHGVVGANNVITNGETYKTMNVRAEEDADFIALTNKKTNTICYYMNINQIPFTSAQYKEAHYFGGDARFTGRVVGNEHIVGKNLQAQQMVFAQAVEASISLISKGDIIGEDLYITNLSVNGGEPQPVEWVWDTSLERYVLCATGKVQGE